MITASRYSGRENKDVFFFISSYFAEIENSEAPKWTPDDQRNLVQFKLIAIGSACLPRERLQRSENSDLGLRSRACSAIGGPPTMASLS